MYTLEQIEDKRRIAAAAGLSGRELLDDTVAVQCDCNGIGAAWMPSVVRWGIGLICPSLVIVADIHDRRYSIGGTEEDRRAADAEFEANGQLIASWRYPKDTIAHNTLRAIVCNRARVMHKYALSRAGRYAWHYTREVYL